MKQNYTEDKIKIKRYRNGRLISQTEYETRKYYDTTNKDDLSNIFAAIDDYLNSNEWD